MEGSLNAGNSMSVKILMMNLVVLGSNVACMGQLYLAWHRMLTGDSPFAEMACRGDPLVGF